MGCECFKCGTEMTNLMAGHHGGFQPGEGLAFYTYGHYGSTIFDPMDGSAIGIAICDECLGPAMETGAVFRYPRW